MSGKFGIDYKAKEEPLSQIYYEASNKITQKIKINPNLVTLSRILIMIALTTMFYFNYLPVLDAILLQLCFFLDHLDGEMARVHNLITKFGDYFDHITDLLYMIPLTVILILRLYKKPYFAVLITILCILGTLCIVFVSYQEIDLAKRNQKSASTVIRSLIFHKMIPSPYYFEHFFRYIGPNILHLFIGALMIYSAS